MQSIHFNPPQFTSARIYKEPLLPNPLPNTNYFNPSKHTLYQNPIYKTHFNPNYLQGEAWDSSHHSPREREGEGDIPNWWGSRSDDHWFHQKQTTDTTSCAHVCMLGRSVALCFWPDTWTTEDPIELASSVIGKKDLWCTTHMIGYKD